MSTFLYLYMVQGIDSCTYNLSPVFQRNILLHHEFPSTVHYIHVPPFNNFILWRGPRCRCLSFDSSVRSQTFQSFACFFFNSCQVPLKHLESIRFLFQKHNCHHSRIIINKQYNVNISFVALHLNWSTQVSMNNLYYSFRGMSFTLKT